MSDVVNLGQLNGHSVGRILKEAVRRAATVIRAERQTFEAHTKLSYGGTMDDVFTSADKAAQEVYLRTFTECFPGCGVLGEEDSYSLAPTPPLTAYFTVDPIDGTTLAAKGMPNAIAVLAVAERGAMYDPSAVFYMEKLVTGPEAADVVDITAPVAENIRRVAKAKEISLAELARRGIETILDQYPSPELIGADWTPPRVRSGGVKVPLERLKDYGEVEATSHQPKARRRG